MDRAIRCEDRMVRKMVHERFEGAGRAEELYRSTQQL